MTFSPSTTESSKAVSLPPTYSVFTTMLRRVFQDFNTGFYLRTRTDDYLMNLRRLKAKSKTMTAVFCELLSADDAAFKAHSEKDMQLIIAKFADP